MRAYYASGGEIIDALIGRVPDDALCDLIKNLGERFDRSKRANDFEAIQFVKAEVVSLYRAVAEVRRWRRASGRASA